MPPIAWTAWCTTWFTACVRGKKRTCPESGRSVTNRTGKSPSNARRVKSVDEATSLARLSRLVIQGLAAGHAVEIEGLGVFFPDRARGFRFQAASGPKI